MQSATSATAVQINLALGFSREILRLGPRHSSLPPRLALTSGAEWCFATFMHMAAIRRILFSYRKPQILYFF